jgi:hypothetical protein
MKHRSTKTDAIVKRMKQTRLDFKIEAEVCHSCGTSCVGDIHEICSGPVRLRAYQDKAAWLHLCRTCHNEIQNWPLERQLALKQDADPENYCLSVINRLIAPRTVYQEDVDKCNP